MCKQILVYIFTFVGVNTVYIMINKFKATNIYSLYAHSAAKKQKKILNSQILT